MSSSGTFLLGDETAALEADLAEWTSVGHAVAVSSGAAALQLALAAVGVAAGDEVIVPAFTAVPTASAVAALGAEPVFVDVDADTAALDLDLVQAARTARTRAAVVVHLYGRPADLPETDLAVVEDAAQAHGALRDHTRSAATIYSFYPTKNVGGVGDGGAVVTARSDVAQTIRLLRAHGMTEQYVHSAVSAELPDVRSRGRLAAGGVGPPADGQRGDDGRSLLAIGPPLHSSGGTPITSTTCTTCACCA